MQGREKERSRGLEGTVSTESPKAEGYAVFHISDALLISTKYTKEGLSRHDGQGRCAHNGDLGKQNFSCCQLENGKYSKQRGDICFTPNVHYHLSLALVCLFIFPTSHSRLFSPPVPIDVIMLMVCMSWHCSFSTTSACLLPSPLSTNNQTPAKLTM